MLSFDQGTCERGSVSADGVGLGLELRWTEAATLQVTHAESVVLEPSPDGEYLQCGDRKVRVMLRSRRAPAERQR